MLTINFGKTLSELAAKKDGMCCAVELRIVGKNDK